MERSKSRSAGASRQCCCALTDLDEKSPVGPDQDWNKTTSESEIRPKKWSGVKAQTFCSPTPAPGTLTSQLVLLVQLTGQSFQLTERKREAILTLQNVQVFPVTTLLQFSCAAARSLVHHCHRCDCDFHVCGLDWDSLGSRQFARGLNAAVSFSPER